MVEELGDIRLRVDPFEARSVLEGLPPVRLMSHEASPRGTPPYTSFETHTTMRLSDVASSVVASSVVTGSVVAAANDGLSIASSVNDSLKSSAFCAPTEAP